MPYLRGDYYRGDYYRGDPGFFGDLFGGLKKLAGAAIGQIPIVGQAFQLASAGRAALMRHGVQMPVVNPTGIPISSSGAESMLAAVNPVNQAAGGVNPGNLPAIRAPQNLAMQAMPAMALMAQPGHRRLHPNKSTYVTRGGGTSRWPPQLEVHFKGTEAVPTRRMNVANPRALRRALRRVAGFAKITKRVRRAVSMAASAVGVRHHGKKAVRRK